MFFGLIRLDSLNMFFGLIRLGSVRLSRTEPNRIVEYSVWFRPLLTTSEYLYSLAVEGEGDPSIIVVEGRGVS